MTRIPKFFGYYLHKDGTPVVCENLNDEVISDLKDGGYWIGARPLNTDSEVHKFLESTKKSRKRKIHIG
jgi:hypothetical protein